MKYGTIFKALKIQEEIVILQEIQELQDSVPRLPFLKVKVTKDKVVGQRCWGSLEPHQLVGGETPTHFHLDLRLV